MCIQGLISLMLYRGSFSLCAGTVEDIREHFSRKLVLKNALEKATYCMSLLNYYNVHKHIKGSKRALK